MQCVGWGLLPSALRGATGGVPGCCSGDFCVILQGTVQGPSFPHPNADYAQQQKEILIYLKKKKGCQGQGK